MQTRPIPPHFSRSPFPKPLYTTEHAPPLQVHHQHVLTSTLSKTPPPNSSKSLLLYTRSSKQTVLPAMFAVMPSYPVFNDFSYQPTRSSPLSSSSPIRASSPPPAPLSPCDYNRQPRQVQSSPVQAPPSKFKFSARPARPNPVVRNREVTQQSRRNLFLKGVQQRADDHRWERRGVEHKVRLGSKPG